MTHTAIKRQKFVIRHLRSVNSLYAQLVDAVVGFGCEVDGVLQIRPKR
ncbi:hypothetical protein SAMN05444271_10986 [Halohasta litchfieldiae]|jgi:hypothetical protein|uniref:Uncharacterized protein n=1 Tax=Halohasta litchfieldiae TaxID=1073996 RepID=A0A1H6TXX1_9EURY|nr:hypothetical protein SAMN05444271_10986 [Halohasta litchfieldiae]